MKFIKIIRLAKFISASTVPVFFFSCSDDSNGPSIPDIEISFPLDQKAVYANATFLDYGDSLVMQNLRISSLIFNQSNVSHDTTYLSGESEQYIANAGTNLNGNILIGITSKWIEMENISPGISSDLLFKTTTDSTKLPTPGFQHFPIAPRFLKKGRISLLSRQENNDSNWQINAVNRRFRIGQDIKWEDNYGFEDGLFVETSEYPYNNDTLYTHSIFDENGVVISQNSINLIFSTGTQKDTIVIHQLNRRIKNFDNPLFIRELKFYADQILENGLTLFYQ